MNKQNQTEKRALGAFLKARFLYTETSAIAVGVQRRNGTQSEDIKMKEQDNVGKSPHTR